MLAVLFSLSPWLHFDYHTILVLSGLLLKIDLFQEIVSLNVLVALKHSSSGRTTTSDVTWVLRVSSGGHTGSRSTEIASC